jgi:hypothetical protein
MNTIISMFNHDHLYQIATKLIKILRNFKQSSVFLMKLPYSVAIRVTIFYALSSSYYIPLLYFHTLLLVLL